MRRNGGEVRVIDTERHVVEPEHLWEEYLAPEYRKEVRWAQPGRLAVEAGGRLMVDGLDMMRAVEPAVGDGVHRFDRDATLAGMDRDGVDVAILYPSAGLYAIWGDHLDAELAAAICAAYNDWLTDFCAGDARLRPVALLPLQDVERAITEARRVAPLRFAGVLMRPNPLRKRQLHDEAYFPLYAALQELRLCVCVHSSPGCLLPEIGVRDATGLEWPQGVQRFDGLFARAAISYPLEIMGAVISMAGEEPIMLFPDLKVHFASAGAGWLFFWIERMDDEWFHRGNDALTKLKPGHYFERQGLVAAYSHEGMLPYLIEEFERNLAWGSRYPHALLADVPAGVEAIADSPALGQATKQNILWNNAARVFEIA